MLRILVTTVILYVLLSMVSHAAGKYGVNVQVFVMRSFFFVIMLFVCQVAFWVMIALWGGDPVKYAAAVAAMGGDVDAARQPFFELDRLRGIQKIMFYATPVYAWLLSFNIAAMFGANNKSGEAALIANGLGQIANILGLAVPLIIIVLVLVGVMDDGYKAMRAAQGHAPTVSVPFFSSGSR